MTIWTVGGKEQINVSGSITASYSESQDGCNEIKRNNKLRGLSVQREQTLDSSPEKFNVKILHL